MIQSKVKFMAVKDIERFTEIANKYPFKIELKMDKYVLDAKSLMSLFCLELSKPIDMNLDTDDDAGFLQEVEDYLV